MRAFVGLLQIKENCPKLEHSWLLASADLLFIFPNSNWKQNLSQKVESPKHTVHLLMLGFPFSSIVFSLEVEFQKGESFHQRNSAFSC